VIQRVLSITAKRYEQRTVTFLTALESQALIDAPPQHRWEGRRDRAMLILTIQAGLRVSELVAIDCGDVALGTGGHLRVDGARDANNARSHSRKRPTRPHRLGCRTRRPPQDPLFPARTGPRLSRDAVEHRVASPDANPLPTQSISGSPLAPDPVLELIRGAAGDHLG
jgi:integrase